MSEEREGVRPVVTRETGTMKETDLTRKGSVRVRREGVTGVHRRGHSGGIPPEEWTGDVDVGSRKR